MYKICSFSHRFAVYRNAIGVCPTKKGILINLFLPHFHKKKKKGSMVFLKLLILHCSVCR